MEVGYIVGMKNPIIRVSAYWPKLRQYSPPFHITRLGKRADKFLPGYTDNRSQYYADFFRENVLPKGNNWMHPGPYTAARAIADFQKWRKRELPSWLAWMNEWEDRSDADRYIEHIKAVLEDVAGKLDPQQASHSYRITLPKWSVGDRPTNELRTFRKRWTDVLWLLVFELYSDEARRFFARQLRGAIDEIEGRWQYLTNE